MIGNEHRRGSEVNVTECRKSAKKNSAQKRVVTHKSNLQTVDRNENWNNYTLFGEVWYQFSLRILQLFSISFTSTGRLTFSAILRNAPQGCEHSSKWIKKKQTVINPLTTTSSWTRQAIYVQCNNVALSRKNFCNGNATMKFSVHCRAICHYQQYKNIICCTTVLWWRICFAGSSISYSGPRLKRPIFSQQIFRKVPISNCTEIRPVAGSLTYANRRTDMKPTGAF